jgi:hypothetical protein
MPALETNRTATQELYMRVYETARDHNFFRLQQTTIHHVPFGMNDMQITKLLDAKIDLKHLCLKLQETQNQNSPLALLHGISCLLANHYNREPFHSVTINFLKLG